MLDLCTCLEAFEQQALLAALAMFDLDASQQGSVASIEASLDQQQSVFR